MRRGALVVVIIAAIAGGVLSGLSTSQHFRIQREGLLESSYCAINERINCDIVNASSYSEFLGVPIAWWGLCFYVLIGGLALWAFLSRNDRRDAVAFAWVLSIGGILYSAFLSYVSIVILETVCIECLGMYLVNILFVVFLFAALDIRLGGLVRFVVSYVQAFFGRRGALEFRPHALRFIALTAVVYAAGWLVIAQVQAKMPQPRDEKLDAQIAAFFQQSEYDIPVQPTWAVWGNPNAAVTVVEFSEYQCPFCRLSAFSLKPYLNEFRDDIRYYFVNYPLDSSCNPALSRPMHPLACEAARAGICANDRGKFWQYHDQLFRHQRGLSREVLLKTAEGFGWPRAEFEACMESPATAEKLERDVDIAQRVYISGTPTIFLDNRMLKNWRDRKFVQGVVQEEIARKKKENKAAAKP